MSIEGIPEGYDLVRVGYPEVGELWPLGEGFAAEATDKLDPVLNAPVAILTRLAAWRRIGDASVPTLPTRARFRMYSDDSWEYGTLTSYRPGPVRWQRDKEKWYRFCEIQDNA